MPGEGPHDVRIKINGSDLPQSAMSDLQALQVHEDLEAPSMFSLDLHNWDAAKLEFTWSDDRLFAPGNEVEVWLGYVDNLKKVMQAEITSLEPSFQADQPPMLTVRGYDRRHRLLRGSKTRSFSKMKDSDIASQIASEAGLSAKVTDTKVVQEYVLQNNRTDLDFLQDRAARYGYEVFVQEKILYFRPHQIAGNPQLTLTLGEEITEFQPRLTTVPQVSEVVVRGWDVMKKEVIAAQARAGAESSTMGGTTTGPKLGHKAFGQSSLVQLEQGAVTKADADQIAAGQFNGMALTHVTGEVVCLGTPDLRAGTVVKIEGAGKNFSGPYYVTAVTHTVSGDAGYQTHFSVRRNAA